jgi:hypothetical protein
LLRFEFEFEHRGQRCRAEVILTSPTDADIDRVLADGLRQLDLMLPPYLAQGDGRVRYVFTFVDGQVKLQFAVRRDAVPVFPVAPGQTPDASLRHIQAPDTSLTTDSSRDDDRAGEG